MIRGLFWLVLICLPSVLLAEDRLPTPDYHREASDPEWLAQVVQFHGHLGPSVVAGARIGMVGLRAVGAKGYFDVEVTCEGPFAQPPQSCFLDGLQAGTGATLGKRTLQWKQANEVVIRFRNTRTGRTAELRPKALLLETLGGRKAAAGERKAASPAHAEIEAIARKIAALPEDEVASVTESAASTRD